MAATFFLVATPIGNLEDFTPRAARVLREADLVLAEDTRHSAKLMQQAGAKAPLLSCHEFNERERLERVVTELKAGRHVALVSDAGTPGISDPGFFLTRALREQGFPVVPIPGPVAAMVALCASGLPTDRFTFFGFPPDAAGKRRAFFAEAATLPHTTIFYLSPHKAGKQLADAAAVFGERKAVLARELTKLFETFTGGTVAELAAQVAAEAPKGELVLLIAGAEVVVAESPDEAATRLREEGLAGKDLMKALIDQVGLTRREAYRLAHAESFSASEEDDDADRE